MATNENLTYASLTVDTVVRHVQRHEVEIQDRTMGRKAAVCSCGVESASTNRPQHLSRWIRSHKAR